MTLTWSSLDTWQALKLNLQIEAEAILSSSGTIIIITPADESGSVLILESGRKSLKLTWVPELNAVRWDTEREYSFEKVIDSALLAHKLILLLRR